MNYSYESKHFVNKPDSLFQGAFIFVSCLLTWFISYKYINPFIRHSINKAISFESSDISQLFGHMFTYSLATTLCCYVLYLVFVRLGYFKAIKLGFDRESIIVGVVTGIIMAVIAAPFLVYKGWTFGFDPNFFSIIGNIFSNTYEEFVYRIFVFLGTIYLFKDIRIGLVVSASIFGLSHSDYPWDFQILVALMGGIMSLSYLRTRSFASVVIAHQVVDIIVDSILFAPM